MRHHIHLGRSRMVHKPHILHHLRGHHHKAHGEGMRQNVGIMSYGEGTYQKKALGEGKKHTGKRIHPLKFRL